MAEFSISIQKQTLAEIINQVVHGLAPRPSALFQEAILIESHEDGRVVFTTTDGSMAIRATNQSMYGEEGRACVSGKLFAETIRKLPDRDDITLTFDSKKVTIKSGKIKSSISLIDESEYPKMEEPSSEATVITMGVKRFKEMAQRVGFATAQGEERPALTGINFEVGETGMNMVALDGFRLALSKDSHSFSNVPNGKMSSIIPAKTMNELIKMLPGDNAEMQIAMEKNKIFFAFEDTLFYSVLMNEKFIDYAKLIPNEFKYQVKVNRESLMSAIDRAALMARESKSNLLKFHYDPQNGIIEITSRAEAGDITEQIEIETIDGVKEPITVAFSARFIGDLGKSITDDVIELKFNDALTPTVVYNTRDNDDGLYLVLPVRAS